MFGQPFRLAIVARQIVGGDEEEDQDDDKGGGEGNGAEAADGAVGVAGAGRMDDDSLDEGGLFVGGRHGEGLVKSRS